jgi:hypothetical protein
LLSMLSASSICGTPSLFEEGQAVVEGAAAHIVGGERGLGRIERIGGRGRPASRLERAAGNRRGGNGLRRAAENARPGGSSDAASQQHLKKLTAGRAAADGVFDRWRRRPWSSS